MKRMTPTQFAKQGPPVKLLGSLRAVLEAMPAGGVLVAKDFEQVRAAADIWHELGRDEALDYVLTSSGVEPLHRVSADKVIGVAPDAWRGAFNTRAWEDIQHLIQTRFATVHFG